MHTHNILEMSEFSGGSWNLNLANVAIYWGMSVTEVVVCLISLQLVMKFQNVFEKSVQFNEISATQVCLEQFVYTGVCRKSLNFPLILSIWLVCAIVISVL